MVQRNGLRKLSSNRMLLFGSFLFVCFLIGLLWFCFNNACLYGILSFWVFWKSYVLVAKLWFCLIYAATDVCSWDFVVFELKLSRGLLFLHYVLIEVLKQSKQITF